MGWLEHALNFLNSVGETFGFTGLVAILFAIAAHFQARYMVKKMEKLYTREIDRIAEARNELEQYILDDKRLTTKSPNNDSENS